MSPLIFQQPPWRPNRLKLFAKKKSLWVCLAWLWPQVHQMFPWGLATWAGLPRPPASTFTPFPAAVRPLLLAAPGSLCGGGFPRELSRVAGTPTPHPAMRVPAPNTSRPALHCFSPQQGSGGNDHVRLSPCVASPQGSRQTEPVQRHPTKHGPSLRIYASQRTPLPCLMGPAKWISSWRPH